MRRREFLGLLSGAAAAWPSDGFPQSIGRKYRLGMLSPSPQASPFFGTMLENLRKSDFIEGQNLTVVFRSYGQRVEHVSEFATEIVKAGVDAIFAGGDFGIRAAQSATTTIPIIGFTDDMIGSGLVKSLARPDGNTTGFSLLAADLDGKRQDLLIEAVPGLRRIATFADPTTSTSRHIQNLSDAARARNVEISIYWINNAAEIATAVEAAIAANAPAYNILASPLLFSNRKIIVDRAAAQRVPTIFQWPEVAEEGALLGYGPRLSQLYRDLVAPQIVRILGGAKPADLPVQQPTTFELAINLKTAKAIAHELPATLVLRADRLIE
jgi:putative tryptophan/tyrosine transport system substrate-binding protein